MSEPAGPSAPRRRRTGRVAFWTLFGLAVACVAGSFLSVKRTAMSVTVPAGALAMMNTVRPGDTVVLERGGFRRGDLVLVRLPGGGSPVDYIRRVIGLPGDRVACCDKAGDITVDGRPLHESYLYPGDKPSGARFSVTLGAGQAWLMGDHRDIAIDSRMWGALPVSDLAGRAAAIYRGGAFESVTTPAAFTAQGLAPPDNRVPWPLVWLALGSVGVLALVVLIIFGVLRWAIRRSRARRHAAAG